MAVIAKQKLRATSALVDVNGGRDRGQLIRELDPEGKIVEHVHILTATYVDRLYAGGLLSSDAREGADMRDAADRLRRDWIEADVQVGAIRSLEAMQGGKGRDPIGDEEAYRRYAEALDSLRILGPRIVLVARCAVIEERPVAIEPLRRALHGLLRHYTQRRARKA
jgi:hypothetical protein